MGKPWHPQCFTCDKCAKQLSPNNFYEKNGKPYCEDDYHKLFSPKCEGCLTPITDVRLAFPVYRIYNRKTHLITLTYGHVLLPVSVFSLSLTFDDTNDNCKQLL